MDASGVQNGMPTCTIGHRLWPGVRMTLLGFVHQDGLEQSLVMPCHALLLIRDLSDLKSKMTGWHDDVWSSYDHVWWCVMLCDVPFKSKDSSLDLWRLRWRWCAAWKTATCHPASWPVASMPQIQILSGSEAESRRVKGDVKKRSQYKIWLTSSHRHTSTKMESLSLHHPEIFPKYERSKVK